MRTIIYGGTLLTPGAALSGHALVIEGGKISQILPERPSEKPGDTWVNATGKMAAPGFIDLHVHGGDGSDTMEATPAALRRMARFYAQHGVTSYLATTWSASQERLMAAIHNVAASPQPEDGAQHLGVHVEGPYLNPDYRGAQPLEHIRLPDPAEYTAWFETGAVKLVTVAPEMEGVLEFIQWGRQRGIEFAIGHSAASCELVQQAAELGARQATHTCNAMGAFNHRTPGTLGGVLSDDRIFAQVIADGVHLHPAAVKVVERAKTPARTLLITDAICGAGLADGEYDLFGIRILVRGGEARTPSGALAGSMLTMEGAVRNAAAFCQLPLATAVEMATRVPAEALGIYGQKGVLAPGADADIVLLDEHLAVAATIISGRMVYRAV
jgi:N-acetylglucosamine-6-phosphate deacetylase